MSEQPATPPGVPEWDTADRLRKALRHADLGVQEMASYLDVSRNTVGNWINGRVDPSTQTLRLWALRCGVSYEWLTGTRIPAVAAVQRDVSCAGNGRHMHLVHPLTAQRAA